MGIPEDSRVDQRSRTGLAWIRALDATGCGHVVRHGGRGATWLPEMLNLNWETSRWGEPCRWEDSPLEIRILHQVAMSDWWPDESP